MAGKSKLTERFLQTTSGNYPAKTQGHGGKYAQAFNSEFLLSNVTGFISLKN